MDGDAGPLVGQDQELIAAASGLIRERYEVGRHHIAAAVRDGEGRIFLGLHLDTYVGRASVCAEAGAIGAAKAAGAGRIDAIVSVRHPRPTESNKELQVVAPCGICRELLNDFAADAVVILPDDGIAGPLRRVPVSTLLPARYRRLP